MNELERAINTLIASIHHHGALIQQQITQQTSAAKVQSTVSGGMSPLSLPVPYATLLESFLISGKLGEVFPYYVRQTAIVPAGTSAQIVTTIPPGDTATVVYLQNMTADTYSPEFLVTFQADQYPPLFVEAPLNEVIDILGSFLLPAHTQGLYTLINNDTVDIAFTTTVQLVMMTSQFWSQVYEPITKGQFDLLNTLAAELLAKQGA